MLRYLIALSLAMAFFAACQKPMNSGPADNRPIGDTTILPGDSLTYEVLTADNRGWYGIWSRPDSGFQATPVIYDTLGGSVPAYQANGWKFSFVAPNRPFQPFMSVFTFSFSDNIVVNLYHNRQLIRTAMNMPSAGFARLSTDVQVNPITGTASRPVLTYEVVTSERDLGKFQSDAWIGQWTTPRGAWIDASNRLMGGLFPMPSGWKYSFQPDQLPFKMAMSAGPYSFDGAKVTIRFYVNGNLMLTKSSRDPISSIEYMVQ